MPRKRILVVDDEPTVLETLRLVLAHDGHILETASDDIEAMQKFDAGEFDLVLTDLRLPGMQGNELAQEIKRRNPSQRIIMLTAFPLVKRPEGCERVLAKPFSVVELRNAVAESS